MGYIMTEDYLKIGVISSTHGVHGEVKVFPTTDDMNRFKKLKNLFLLKRDGQYLPLEIRSVKFFKNQVILGFKDILSLNDVEIYKCCELYVDRQNAVKLNKDEYFIADIIDSEVVSDDGQYHGVLNDVYQTGANDVYEILLDDGQTVLIPAIHDCILNVDPKTKKIVFHMMDGLI